MDASKIALVAAYIGGGIAAAVFVVFILLVLIGLFFGDPKAERIQAEKEGRYIPEDDYETILDSTHYKPVAPLEVVAPKDLDKNIIFPGTWRSKNGHKGIIFPLKGKTYFMFSYSMGYYIFKDNRKDPRIGNCIPVTVSIRMIKGEATVSTLKKNNVMDQVHVVAGDNVVFNALSLVNFDPINNPYDPGSIDGNPYLTNYLYFESVNGKDATIQFKIAPDYDTVVK